MRRGDRGSRVRRAQEALLAQGYKLPNYGADGDYGRETEAALAKWASDNRVPRRAGRLDAAAYELLTAARSTPAAPPRAGDPVYGAFLWQASKLSTQELIDLVAETGLGRVMPKVANKHGRPMYEKTLARHIPALQEAGVEVIPWAYLDDQRGAQDAEVLAGLSLDYGCTGAVANMEREVVDGDTKPERQHDAREIDDVLTVLSAKLPGFVGFSSFRRRDYFPWPRDVFEKHAERVTYMPQCYNQQAPAASRKRTRKSAESWLAWPLNVRMTLGAFPPKASQSKSFGSKPEGMVAAADEVARMALEHQRLDPGFDWWALEQVRDGYAPAEYRQALYQAHGGTV